MELIKEITEKLRGKDATIVFPEGEDKRILGAASKLADEGIVKPLVLGHREEVEKTATEIGVDMSKIDFYDIDTSEKMDELVAAFVERRKGKVTEDQAREMLKTPNYFGTMLVYQGYADGLVSGAVGTTANTVRPALQIIKTEPGVSKTSGAFLMVRDDELYLMADCAINIDPTAEDLAEIAVESDRTARQFGIEPRIAMLSFSTMGSASHEMVDKVATATAKAKEMNPDMTIDGELQFDAAFVPEVGKKKAPNSKVAGNANVFIFPSLEAGNIGYKIGQRFGGFNAIGPVLQGLNKPVNDLSRGCDEAEVISLAKVTAAQAKL